jgi:hypothetical protein
MQISRHENLTCKTVSDPITSNMIYIYQVFICILSVFLVGCADPRPKYIEPDPKTTQTARLRICVLPGAHARIALHPNSDADNCLKEKGSVSLPFHENSSGFAGDSEIKIGMPLGDTYWGKIGAEMYISATSPITIGVEYSATGTVYRTYCGKAFRFQPNAGKDYQLSFMFGDSPNGRSCILDFKEVSEGDLDSTGKLTSPNVPYVPVIANGSPAWELVCVKKLEKN